MKLSRLSSFGLMIPLATGIMTAIDAPAKAGIIGSVDIAGQIDFPRSNPPGGPFAPPEFFFRQPAVCNNPNAVHNVNKCDFTVTDATGVLAYTLNDPVSKFFKFDTPDRLDYTRTPASVRPSFFLPSSSASGPGAPFGSCVVNPIIGPNTAVPDFKCSGEALDPVAAADPNKQINEKLIPTVGAAFPFLTLALDDDNNNIPDLPFYRTSITKITSFSTQGLSTPTAQTAVAFDLLWELVDASGTVFKQGDGSINATFQSNGSTTSYSGQLVIREKVPEPTAILGIAFATTAGALTLKRKKQSN